MNIDDLTLKQIKEINSLEIVAASAWTSQQPPGSGTLSNPTAEKDIYAEDYLFEGMDHRKADTGNAPQGNHDRGSGLAGVPGGP